MNPSPITYLSTARRSAVDLLQGLGFLPPPALQIAAICHRQGAQGLEVLLITSRGTKQWILPKGWPKRRGHARDTALAEAYEEAGIIGTASNTPIGRFAYRKTDESGLVLDCRAEVYEIAVSATRADFPEAGQRKLKWTTPEIAAEKVTNPDLRRLLLSFSPSLTN